MDSVVDGPVLIGVQSCTESRMGHFPEILEVPPYPLWKFVAGNFKHAFSVNHHRCGIQISKLQVCDMIDHLQVLAYPEA